MDKTRLASNFRFILIKEETMEEHLKEVCLCNNNLHFSHLLPMISAYEISKEHIEEFKDVLHHLIKEAKKLKNLKLLIMVEIAIC